MSDWQRRDGDALRLTVNRSRAVVPMVMTVFAGCRLTWIFRPSINQGCDIDALVWRERVFDARPVHAQVVRHARRVSAAPRSGALWCGLSYIEKV